MEEKEEALGLLYISVFNSSLEVFKQHLTSLGQSGEAKLHSVNEYIDRYENLGWKAAAVELKHWKFAKAWNRKHRKLGYHVREGTPTAAIVTAMQEHLLQFPGYRLMFGQAPKGDLERKLQLFLDGKVDEINFEDDQLDEEEIE